MGTRTVATATVLDAAVTALDVDVRVSVEGKPATDDRSRLLVEATRTEAGWKGSAGGRRRITSLPPL